MSDQINDSTDWNDETNLSMKERRGNFLLTICILSWVYIGLMLIMTFFNYLKGTDELEQSLMVLEEGTPGVEGNPFAETMVDGAMVITERTIENFQGINLSTMAALLLGGLSVLLMFNLKKLGFGLYVLYSIAVPTVSLYFLGADQQITIWTVAASAVVSVAFIIMYGVNLKRMTA